MMPTRALGRRGNASLEFAVIAMPVFMLYFSIVQIGQAAGAQHALDLASATAARYAALHGSQSSSPASVATVKSAFTTTISPTLGRTGIAPSVSVTYSPDNHPGSTVSVVATYAWRPAIPMVVLPAVTLSTRAVLIIQN